MSHVIPVEEAVVIAGGYGVVGRQIAQVLRRRYPQLPLLLAGRHPGAGALLADELGRAGTFALDVEAPVSFGGVRPRAIVAAVNDPADHLLLAAARAGVPYVDITRWTQRLRQSVLRLAPEPLAAPVMFASSWMAGSAAVLAAAAARGLARVERIEIGILYGMRDAAGPNSVAYMDRLTEPYEVLADGEWRRTRTFSTSRHVTFPSGRAARVYDLDVPDLLTLPLATGARTVSARIAFDDAGATAMLAGLVRSGVWGLFAGERFTSLRRGMLYHPGPGDRHEVVVEVTGEDPAGRPRTLVASLSDPAGQTHLTAVGAAIQLARVLGLDGAPGARAGVSFPDTAPQLDDAIAWLRAEGVSVALGQDEPVLAPGAGEPLRAG